VFEMQKYRMWIVGFAVLLRLLSGAGHTRAAEKDWHSLGVGDGVKIEWATKLSACLQRLPQAATVAKPLSEFFCDIFSRFAISSQPVI
jgi:hypothetical protein